LLIFKKLLLKKGQVSGNFFLHLGIGLLEIGHPRGGGTRKFCPAFWKKKKIKFQGLV